MNHNKFRNLPGVVINTLEQFMEKFKAAEETAARYQKAAAAHVHGLMGGRVPLSDLEDCACMFSSFVYLLLLFCFSDNLARRQQRKRKRSSSFDDMDFYRDLRHDPPPAYSGAPLGRL